MTMTELADRLSIRALVDAYARCADRRDANGQKALFTEDTRFVIYMEGEGSEPTRERSDHTSPSRRMSGIIRAETT